MRTSSIHPPVARRRFGQLLPFVWHFCMGNRGYSFTGQQHPPQGLAKLCAFPCVNAVRGAVSIAPASGALLWRAGKLL
jgi:hypothetical protein